MINFISISVVELQEILTDCTQKELFELMNYTDDVIDKQDCLPFDVKKKYSLRKELLVNYIVSIFMSKNSVLNIYQKLMSTEISKYVYQKLIWETDSFPSSEIVKRFDYRFKNKPSSYYEDEQSNLTDELSLVLRTITRYYQKLDRLSLNPKFKKILKLVTPIPQDYDLEPIENIVKTKYSYSNEENILHFITTIENMLKSNLVEFGKSNEKPLLKSLNILKTSTTIQEFYNQTGLNSLATDMLTRSFYFYYKAIRNFEKLEQDTLKNFISIQFKDNFSFFITRIFLAHLKNVRYDSYYSKQKELFTTVHKIIDMMPKESFVSVKNIINFCKYRDLKVDIEVKDKVNEYYLETDKGEGVDGYSYYDAIAYEPTIKASLFYLGALGLLELEYNDLISAYNISAKGKLYISPWDSLEYVKLTELGKYVFDFSKSYSYEKKEYKNKNVKFDEYKPIITVDNDVIMLAKLEQFTEKYADNKYIVTHAKVFKDCNTVKDLERKIEAFYRQIESNPPQVFKDFFEEIKQNAGLLNKDTKHFIIELKNNKKLLNLFMTNKKLQEIVIKAQGYRVIIEKENLPKLTRIVKDNGFFIDF